MVKDFLSENFSARSALWSEAIMGSKRGRSPLESELSELSAAGTDAAFGGWCELIIICTLKCHF